MPYFYHSFPRRGSGKGEEVKKGLQILAAIRDYGLLLTPEAHTWLQPLRNGGVRDFPVLQCRACFTEIEPGELPEHARLFGGFALEFDLMDLRTAGAQPVFYIPQPLGDDASALPTGLIAALLDAKHVAERLRYMQFLLGQPGASQHTLTIGASFENPGSEAQLEMAPEHHEHYRRAVDFLGKSLTPFAEMHMSLDAISNYFYPTDNTRSDGLLQYYRQREWRIAANFSYVGPDGKINSALHIPQGIERTRIQEIDPDFFSRTYRSDTQTVSAFDACLLYPFVFGKSFLQLARRIIVPDEAVSAALVILEAVENRPTIVGISQLA